MLMSMTGYGKRELENSDISISVELKSINSRYLEVNHKIPRLFSDDVVYDSHIENDKKDVDGKLLTTKPVGGHRISDMELIRMTPEERNQAFIDEGLGDTFDFNKNCRAMSKYHNLRMGVLRLSEYLPIIDNDKEVRELRIKKYESLKQKEILV